MKSKIPFGLFSIFAVVPVYAQGLYHVGNEPDESLPLKWVVGVSAIYDDNVAPGQIDARGNEIEDSSFGLNPSVGLTFTSITPQTTWDVYARLGLIYYFDAPDYMDDVSSQSRAGVNLTHRFSERLRFLSRNFISYELEPDYSYGYASSRQSGEYLYWQTDNSLGYRWSERFATYTGFRLTGTTYADVANNDRFTWEAYNQVRYQMNPQTVLTADYRYSQTIGDGVSSDSTDQYLLGGVEYRFSPTTIGIVRAGAQFRDVDDGDNSTSPYLEFALNTRVTKDLSVRSFARYGIEYYDTVQAIDTNNDGVSDSIAEYDDRQTLRFGVSAEYTISPMFSLFSGIDYIPTSYSSGRSVSTPPFLGAIPDADEDIFNAYIGLSVKFNDYLTGVASYNFTNSSSDLIGREYDRNRINLGVTWEF